MKRESERKTSKTEGSIGSHRTGGEKTNARKGWQQI